MTTIYQLPLELVSEIAQYLPQQDLYSCTLVNKKFFQASNRWLWRAPKRVTQTTLTDFMTCLFKAHHSVELHIRTISFWSFKCSNYELLRLLKHVSKLQELTILGDQRFSDNMLKYIPGYCRHLKSLTLNVGHITYVSMDNLGQYCHQLTQLKLVMSRTTTQVNTRFFEALVRCPLKKLWLSGFKLAVEMTPGDVDRLFTNLAALDGLTHLTLQGRARSTSAMFDGTRCLKVVFLNLNGTPTWPDLVDLHLMPCFKLDDSLAIDFIKTHPQLKSLYLCGPTPALPPLPPQPRLLPPLPPILPPIPFDNVIHHLPNNNNNNNNINNNNDDNEDHHEIIIPPPSNFRPPAPDNEGISDMTLEAITTYLPTIQKIGVSNHGRLTPQGLKHLIQQCPRLKKLYFSSCGIKITDFPASCVNGNDDDGVYLEWLNDHAMRQFRNVMTDQQQQQQKQQQQITVDDKSVATVMARGSSSSPSKTQRQRQQ